MAQECGFFNAQLAGEEYDRVYLAEQFAAYFASFIGNGVFAKSMQELEVIAQTNPSMKIDVLSGQGWINGYWYRNTDNFTLDLSVADGVLSRIDLVVLRWSSSDRDMYLTVIEGVPSANPLAPTIRRDADFYDLELAQVLIGAGIVGVAQAAITDTRMNSQVCGWVHGVVDQIDTTDLYNQFQDFFNQFKSVQLADYTSWTNAQKQAYLAWVAAQEDAYTQFVNTSEADYAKYIADTQAAYDAWVGSKQDGYDTWTAQKQSEYEAYIAVSQKDYDDWVAAKQAAYDSWVSTSQKNYDDWIAQEKAAYEAYVKDQEDSYLEFVTQKQGDYNTWVQQQKDAYDAYIAQQKSAYDTYVAGLKADYDTYTTDKKSEWETWVTEQETAFSQFVSTSTSAYDTWISQQEQAFSLWYSVHTQQWEEDFNTWFESVKNKLAGDIATSLQNQIDDLEALQPTALITTIEHDKQKYVQAFLYETTYACGVQGAGEGPAGGGPLISTPVEYTMADKSHISFKAKPGYGILSEVISLSDDMFIVLFSQKTTSLVLVIS